MALTVILFLIIILAKSDSQDIRSLELYQMSDTNYQCIDPACSPSTIVSVSDIRSCQIACLSDAKCRTVTFDHSTNVCQMFFDIPSVNGNLLTQAGVETMIAIDDRQLLGGK